jgi:hypothetical protein
MSEENVEVVRRLFDAAARRDSAAVFDIYDAYIVWDASRTERGAMAGRVVLGREALLRWLREWYEPWETLDELALALSRRGVVPRPLHDVVRILDDPAIVQDEHRNPALAGQPLDLLASARDVRQLPEAV